MHPYPGATPAAHGHSAGRFQAFTTCGNGTGVWKRGVWKRDRCGNGTGTDRIQHAISELANPSVRACPDRFLDEPCAMQTRVVPCSVREEKSTDEPVVRQTRFLKTETSHASSDCTLLTLTCLPGERSSRFRRHVLRAVNAGIEKVAHYVAQHRREPKGTEETEESEAAENAGVIPADASTFASVPDETVTRPGLEPGITESKSVVLPITLSGSTGDDNE